jgi:hypothetical protein
MLRLSSVLPWHGLVARPLLSQRPWIYRLEGLLAMLPGYLGVSRNTLKLLLGDLWDPTSSVQVVAHTTCYSETQYEG